MESTPYKSTPTTPLEGKWKKAGSISSESSQWILIHTATQNQSSFNPLICPTQYILKGHSKTVDLASKRCTRGTTDYSTYVDLVQARPSLPRKEPSFFAKMIAGEGGGGGKESSQEWRLCILARLPNSRVTPSSSFGLREGCLAPICRDSVYHDYHYP